MRTGEETNSDPPGIDSTENTELQLNHISCESTDSESDTGNTISVNLVEVENDYEIDMNEEPIYSHIYENQLEFLSDYYTRSRKNIKPTGQKVNKVTNSHEPEEKQAICSYTNHIYQNVPKELPREKIWTIHFS